MRARGILIEERCRGGEQQKVAIARLRAHRLLGLRQKPRMAMRISERSPEDLVPYGGHILLFAAQHFFRLIAERENRLRCRITRHTKPCRFACKRNNESTTQADRAYRGTRGIQAGLAHLDMDQHALAVDIAHPQLLWQSGNAQRLAKRRRQRWSTVNAGKLRP